MSEIDLIRELLPRVTPGPWITDYRANASGPHLFAIIHHDGRVLLEWAPGDATHDDAEFIARARAVVPMLLAEVDRLLGLLG